MRLLLLLTYLVMGLGCGARTSLVVPFDDDDGAGGSGAAPTTGGNGGNPSGPGGGGNVPCDELVQIDPIASMAADADMHQRQPVLAYASDALDLVTVASGWVAVESPIDPPWELRHATFAPWGDNWPDNGIVGPSYLADLDAGFSYAAASSTNNRLALLMSDGDKPQAPQGVLFSLDFGPGSGAVPPKYTVSATAERALFAALTREPTPMHLVGVGFPGVPLSAAAFRLTELDNGVSVDGPTPIGCGDDPLVADAIATDEGWVVVASSAPGHEAQPCLDPGPAGPTTAVYLASMNPQQGDLNPCIFYEPDPPSRVERVAAAPHPDGAWVAWALADGRVEVARVDWFGCTAAGFFSVSAPGEGAVATSLAMGNLGRSVVVTYLRTVDLAVVMRAFSENGDVLFDMSVSASTIDPWLDVLGSPDGDSILVAFSSPGPTGAGLVSLTRFDCR